MSNTSGRTQRGFALLEALVAMLIMTIGVLSLAAMQTTINQYSNEAKLRSDATRLAQEKIEDLRSFTGIASTTIGQGATSATALNWNALASGQDLVVSTNTTYTRTWTLSGVVTDPMRNVQVVMDWLNRAGESQSLTLSSVISQTDPADSGYLAFPLPLNTNLKRPKDRNLDIPVRAVDLGDGKSGLRYGTGGQYLVFSNVSGDVVKICTPPSLTASSTDAQLIAALTSTDSAVASCTTIEGFIVAGYIKRSSSVSSTDWNAIKDNLGIDTLMVEQNDAPGSPAKSCHVQDATDQNTGALIADYMSYICVIPLTAPSAGVPYDWSGRIRVSGPSTWRGSSKYFVCRYQYTATSTFTDPNLRNVQDEDDGYTAVNKSIDQQNYLLAMTANSTDTSTPTCPASEMTLSGVSEGVLHQDCRAASNPTYYANDSHGTGCPVTGAASSYTLVYDGNSNTGGTVPTDSSSPYVAGSVVTVLANPGALEKTGYTFGGWATQADGGGSSYVAGNTFTIAGPMVLYAKWLAPASVTYSGNSNSSGTVPIDPGNPYTTGSTVTVLGNPGGLTRSSFSFEGWNTMADGTGANYIAGNTFTITANTTLYAKWNSNSPVSVTYAGNGNTGGTAPTDGGNYSAGAVVTVLSAGTLVKSNATFNGWNTAANGSGTPLAVGATFTISSDTTLYAQWQDSITLATPTPTWQVGAPYTLTWTAPTGATGYNVRSCSTTNNTSLTACTPINPVSQSAASKAASPANKETFCYTVTATGPSPYVESAQSSVKCIYFKNPSTYNTQ